jgi:hypothetical protein
MDGNIAGRNKEVPPLKLCNYEVLPAKVRFA